MDALNIDHGFKFTVDSAYPPHSGLGSGTQLSLAVAKLISTMNNQDIKAVELAKIVGRGGTSGIGVERVSRKAAKGCGHGRCGFHRPPPRPSAAGSGR